MSHFSRARILWWELASLAGRHAESPMRRGPGYGLRRHRNRNGEAGGNILEDVWGSEQSYARYGNLASGNQTSGKTGYEYRTKECHRGVRSLSVLIPTTSGASPRSCINASITQLWPEGAHLDLPPSRASIGKQGNGQRSRFRNVERTSDSSIHGKKNRRSRTTDVDRAVRRATTKISAGENVSRANFTCANAEANARRGGRKEMTAGDYNLCLALPIVFIFYRMPSLL